MWHTTRAGREAARGAERVGLPRIGAHMAAVVQGGGQQRYNGIDLALRPLFLSQPMLTSGLRRVSIKNLQTQDNRQQLARAWPSVRGDAGRCNTA